MYVSGGPPFIIFNGEFLCRLVKVVLEAGVVVCHCVTLFFLEGTTGSPNNQLAPFLKQFCHTLRLHPVGLMRGDFFHDLEGLVEVGQVCLCADMLHSTAMTVAKRIDAVKCLDVVVLWDGHPHHFGLAVCMRGAYLRCQGSHRAWWRAKWEPTVFDQLGSLPVLWSRGSRFHRRPG